MQAGLSGTAPGGLDGCGPLGPDSRRGEQQRDAGERTADASTWSQSHGTPPRRSALAPGPRLRVRAREHRGRRRPAPGLTSPRLSRACAMPGRPPNVRIYRHTRRFSRTNGPRWWARELVTARKPPLSRGICDEPPHIRRGLGHATHRTGTTERRLASNRPAFPTSGHRRPFPSRCAERGGRSPQEMAALRQRGVFDVVRPHACAVAQADRCGAGWRPVLTMQRCAQTHRRRGSAPGRDRDAQGC